MCKPTPGLVYIARNLVNGRVYVGQTTYSLDCRRRSHERSAKAGSNAVFHRALRKYGNDAFYWFVICEVGDEDGYGVGWHEQNVIEYMKQIGNDLYNVSLGGMSPALGMSHTPENKQIMGEAAKRGWDGRRACDLYPSECLEMGFAAAHRKYDIPKTTYYRMKSNG